MKPTILKGTRDFGPQDIKRREYIFSTIKNVFELYGYGPLETPSMEHLHTLTGKYGDEGDALLFKVLNNGDFLSKANPEALENKDSNGLVASISKRGLRYDLTVPFARFVVMNHHALKFPFKRYQIQPVWRADRPQKGRYNEFYQCDVDVVGSSSLLYEAELVKIYDEVFTRLNLSTQIKVNNRKVLYGIAETAGIEAQFVDMTVALDKLDKIGEEKVAEEMERRGISNEAISKVLAGIAIKDIEQLPAFFTNAPTGMKGYEELKQVLSYLNAVEIKQELVFDISLARGLSYYTGCILEVVSKEVKMGSIGGGGRYDDLTSVFGMSDLSGVGISFGAERIYDVLLELDRFPEDTDATVPLILLSLDAAALAHSFNLAATIRSAGIPCDVYPEPAKMKKQMKYAAGRNIPLVMIIGEEEVQSKTYSVKIMETGEQTALSSDILIESLKALI